MPRSIETLSIEMKDRTRWQLGQLLRSRFHTHSSHAKPGKNIAYVRKADFGQIYARPKLYKLGFNLSNRNLVPQDLKQAIDR
jgi:hypothetical protein